MAPWPKEEYEALWCVGHERARPISASNPLVVPPKPLFPRFKYMDEYSCKECKQMVDTMKHYCKMNEKGPTRSQFVDACRLNVLPVAKNPSMILDKCEDFHRFVSDMYCPGDPCNQITITQTNAPDALCDLARCKEDALPGPPAWMPPLSCPSYVEHIMGLCHKAKTKLGPHSKPTITRETACKVFQPRFRRDGCHMVYDKLREVASPLSLCSLSSCDELQGSAADYCVNKMNMTANQSVAVAGYPPESEPTEDCDKSPGGMIIYSASYGVNCTQENHTNNILEAVKADCKGRTKCVFGNRDMANRSSFWDPLQGDTTCVRAFEIKYRCLPEGALHVRLAPESAKFAALPIDCGPEIRRMHRPAIQPASTTNGYHVP